MLCNIHSQLGASKSRLEYIIYKKKKRTPCLSSAKNERQSRNDFSLRIRSQESVENLLKVFKKKYRVLVSSYLSTA